MKICVSPRVDIKPLFSICLLAYSSCCTGTLNSLKTQAPPIPTIITRLSQCPFSQ